MKITKEKMKALILAGGRGRRLNEMTKKRNKSMVELFGKPIIEYNLEHAVEAGVSEIVIVVGYRKEEIINRIGNQYKGIKVTYAVQKEQKGMVDAIETAKNAVGKSDFILMLADEIMINADLRGVMKKFRDESLFAVCGITFESDRRSIGKTYNAMTNEKGRVFRLIEKPRFPVNSIKGTGHCVFRNEIFEYIQKTPINANRCEKEMVDMIQCAVDEGKKVYVYPLSKEYTNINSTEDLDVAKEMIERHNPRVLIIHNQMKYYGGGELLIVELANWLTKRGIKNDILTLSKSRDVENSLINTEIIIPENNLNIEPPGYRDVKSILKAIRIFRKKLREIEKNYDVINFHDFPVTWTLFPKKKPCVWFMNMPPNLWSRPDAGFFYRALNKARILADRIIVRSSVDFIAVAESLNLKRAFERYGKQAKMVHFGINHEFFSNGEKEKAVKKFKLDGKFVVVQSGMITEARNQLESVKAVEKAKEKIQNILMVLAGKEEDRYAQKVKEYIKNKKLEKQILFTGNLKREELRDIYMAADVGLFPIGGQGGVLAPFEVLCAGTPIIISEDMETSELVKRQDIGISTSEYDKALVEVYNNKEKYLEQAKKASLFVKNNLSWGAFSDRMIKLFESAWRRHK